MTTITTSHGARITVEVDGEGPPALVLHGAYSAHEELRSLAAEALPDHRRVLPDLPGMGGSTAVGVASAVDVVDALEEVVEHLVGAEPLVIVAHSFGAHLARGVAARRPWQVHGLALLCPMEPEDVRAEQHVVVEDDGAGATLPTEVAEEFASYFVVRTAATVARFRSAAMPALGRYDGEAVEAQMTRWRLDPDPATVPFAWPVLLMTGRHDAMVGWRQHERLLEAYPAATSIVAADAGHALPHEHPDLVREAIAWWRTRVASAEALAADAHR